VIVVDNASTDETVRIARAAGAEVIANPDNRGFAAAVNQGFRATDAECVLVLNPDAHLRSDLEPLVAAGREHGLAGGQLTDEAGRAQTGFTIRRFPTAGVLALELLAVNHLWPGNRWNRRYRYLDRDLSQAGPAEQPAGACLMVRRDVWVQLGGFDERFWPIWFEDVDFCQRAAEAGYRAQYVPRTHLWHSGGHSIQKIDFSSRQVFWYGSLLEYSEKRYTEKHFRAGEYRILCVAGAVGVLGRTGREMIQKRSLGPIHNCIKILRLVGKRLVSRPRTAASRETGGGVA
jgi:GT2 family glycosyltransferase